MIIEPIVAARFKRYQDSIELTHFYGGIAFERFANHAVLSRHPADTFAADAELMDKICVGRQDEMGIDGIAKKMNGLLIRKTDDVDYITDRLDKRAMNSSSFNQV